MSRYRPQQTPGDNLRDLYSKFQQWISSALGSSSIDWDDSGDDGESLDVTVSDGTVAKYGHSAGKHGFLVPNGGGWQTVQEDATSKANAAEAAAISTANAHSDALNTAMDGRMDTAESDIDTLQSEMNTAQSDINTLQSQMTNRTNRIIDIEAFLDAGWPGWNT